MVCGCAGKMAPGCMRQSAVWVFFPLSTQNLHANAGHAGNPVAFFAANRAGAWRRVGPPLARCATTVLLRVGESAIGEPRLLLLQQGLQQFGVRLSSLRSVLMVNGFPAEWCLCLTIRNDVGFGCKPSSFVGEWLMTWTRWKEFAALFQVYLCASQMRFHCAQRQARVQNYLSGWALEKGQFYHLSLYRCEFFQCEP